MTAFGSYETVREISRSGFSTVFSARATRGDTADKYAVKVFQPIAGAADKTSLQSESQLFLEAAGIQQKLATHSAGYWAPIHETGTTSDGDFYVTDYFPRSLQQLIYGRVKLPGAALHTIIDSVVKALLELKRFCDQPHGNLKPANVLIAGEGGVDRLKIVLTDPLPAKRIDARRDQVADFHGIGELIYQLVTHRPFSSVGGWPVSDSPEWNRLGKQGQVWRALCNRLLTPHLEPESLTLEDVEQKLSELRITKVMSSRLLVVAAIVVFALAITAVMVIKWMTPPPPPPPIQQEEWSSLCLDYYHWIARLQDDQAVRDRWSVNPLLKQEVLARIGTRKTAGIELDPRKISGRDDSLTELADYSSAKLDPDQAKKALEAYNAIKEIKNVIRGPFVDDIEKISRKWAEDKDRGWSSHSQTLDSLISSFNDSIKSSPQPCQELISTVDRFLKVAAVVCKVEQLWANARRMEGMIAQEYNEQKESKLLAISKAGNFDDLQEKIVEYGNWIPTISKSATEWFYAIKQMVFLSGVINKEWENRREEILAQVKLQNLERDPKLYIELRDKVERLSEFFRFLDNDKELPKKFVIEPKTDLAKNWHDVLVEMINAQRETTLKAAIDDMLVDDETVRLKDPDKWEKLCLAYRQLHQDAGSLILDYSTIIDRLEAFYQLDGRPSEGATTVRELFDKWSGHAVFENSQVGQAFGSANKRVNELLDVYTKTDRRQLLNLAGVTSQKPEIVYAAWRKIGELTNPPWPNTEDELKRDDEIRQVLKDLYNTNVSDTVRRDSLLQELDEQKTRRRIVFEFARLGSYPDRIAQYASNLEGETILNQSGDYVARLKNDIQSLSPDAQIKKLQDATQLTVKLLNYLESDQWKNVNKTFFINNSDTYRKFSGTATSQTYNDWLTEVEDYEIISDPRDEWPEIVKVIEGAVAQMPPDFDRAGFETKFGQAREMIAALEDKNKIPAIVKNKNEILLAEGSLRELLNTIKPTQERIDKFLEEVRLGSDIPAVFKDDIWQKVYSALKRDLRPDPSFWSLKIKVEAAREGLIALNDKFPPASVTPPADKTWIKNLIKLADDAHQRILRDVVGKIKLDDSYPDLQDTQFLAQIRDMTENYRKWHELNALIADFNDIDERLDLFYLLDDKSKEDDKTVEQLYSTWKEHNLIKLKDTGVEAELAPVIKRIEQATGINRQEDRETLVKLALVPEQNPDAVYAAWRRLGTLSEPQWPNTQQHRDEDREIRKILARRYQSVEVETRKNVLVEELNQQGRRRDTIFEKAQISRLQVVIAQAAEQTGDRILALFPAFSNAQLSNNDDLENLVRISELAEKLKTFIERDWADKVDRQLFMAESDIHRDFDGKATGETFLAWLREAENYVKLESDPRGQREDWDKRITQIDQLIGQLLQIKPKRAEELRNESKPWNEKVEQLWQLPAVQKNKDTLDKLVKDYDNGLQGFKLDVQKELESPEQWLTRIREHVVKTSSKVINTEWIERRDYLISNVTVQQMAADNWKLYLQKRGKMDTLELFLKSLDDENNLPGEFPDVPQSVSRKEWYNPIKKSLAVKREDVLGNALRQISWVDGAPGTSVEDFMKSAQWTQLSEKYKQWRQDAGQLAVDFSDIEDWLNLGYQLDELPPDRQGTISDIYNKWMNRDAFKESKTEVTLIVNRIEQLRKTASEMDGQKIADLAGNIADASDPLAYPEQIIAVWRKLGEITDWPAHPNDLKLALDLRKALRKLIMEKMDNAARKQAFSRELQDEGLNRWQKCFNNICSKDQSDREKLIGETVALKDEFVEDNSKLSTKSRFNIMIYDRSMKKLDEQAALEEIKSVDQQVEELYKGVEKPQAVQNFLVDLRALLEEESKDDLAEALKRAGPMKNGRNWQAKVSDDSERVEYTWKDHNLTFVNVNDTCYLCTTEVSLGLLVDVIDAENKWAEIKKLLPEKVEGKMKESPWVWNWSRSRTKIVKNSSWLNNFDHQMVKRGSLSAQQIEMGNITKEGLYPEKMEVQEPCPAHPMQNISVEAALYFAQLTGCRLPTVADWQAAYKTVKDFPDDSWNRRDQTWDQYKQHLAGISKIWKDKMYPGYNLLPWPDSGVFKRDTQHTAGDAESAVKGDDGVLWFEEVNQGADTKRTYNFHHLVGNVAEFVYEGYADLDKMTETTDFNTEKVRDFLNNNPNVYVIGASALSPSIVKPDEPYEAEKHDEIYSDVGFRLAFTSPREKLNMKLRRLLGQSYLTN